MLSLVKYYDKKIVKSFVDLTIIPMVGSRGGKPIFLSAAGFKPPTPARLDLENLTL